MKKEIIIAAILLLSLPIITLAQATVDIAKLANAIGKILGLASGLVGIGFVLLGVFRIATAAGDPRTLGEAKVSLFWGVIAIVVGSAMWSATSILEFFGVTVTTPTF